MLVTGGAGFIGSHLTDKLIQQGNEVVVVDNLSTGRKENLNRKAKFYKLDIRSPRLVKVFKKARPEVVFHLAGHVNVRESVNNPVADAEINIIGSLNVLENCRKFGTRKIVFASSGGAVYGGIGAIPAIEEQKENPESPYGAAKLAIEKYLYFYEKNFGITYVALRLANVYGPRQNPKKEAGVTAIFCYKMLQNQDIIINGDGKQTRDFVFIDDVVKAFLLAVKEGKRGVFNIGTGKETSVRELFASIKKLTGFSGKILYGPAKKGEQSRSCLDYSKAERKLNWRPEYTLEEGLRKTVEWFNSSHFKKRIRKARNN